jgi:hypothetical protein
MEPEVQQLLAEGNIADDWESVAYPTATPEQRRALYFARGLIRAFLASDLGSCDTRTRRPALDSPTRRQGARTTGLHSAAQHDSAAVNSDAGVIEQVTPSDGPTTSERRRVESNNKSNNAIGLNRSLRVVALREDDSEDD